MCKERHLSARRDDIARVPLARLGTYVLDVVGTHVDFNQMYRHDDSLGTRVRSRRERKYSQAKLALARGGRALRWHSSAGLSRQGPGFLAYVDKVRKRAARDGKAKQADKAVRFWQK